MFCLRRKRVDFSARLFDFVGISLDVFDSRFYGKVCGKHKEAKSCSRSKDSRVSIFVLFFTILSEVNHVLFVYLLIFHYFYLFILYGNFHGYVSTLLPTLSQGWSDYVRSQHFFHVKVVRLERRTVHHRLFYFSYSHWFDWRDWQKWRDCQRFVSATINIKSRLNKGITWASRLCFC